MSAPEQPKADELKQSLDQLGTETTAADLVRAKGQSRKVRVIHEKQLMEWILKLLQTHLASKADAFSDAEKEALLKKTQDELARRVKREQELANERDKAKQAMGDLMERMSQEHASQGDRDRMLEELRRQLEEREHLIQDLQNDNDDLQDQLSEKLALLSTTISEKDKLRTTVRNQMVRSGALVEGVLGLDSTYYGIRHQNQNPMNDDAGEEEQFYHDFDVGAQIITSLSQDLDRLHQISQAAGGSAPSTDGLKTTEDEGLMARNLALLEQLKSGSLHAMDVAQPVEGLVEALGGARAEAESFRDTLNAALGAASAHASDLSDLPEADGDPAVVLAGATTVARELARELALGRDRVRGLKQMADEADAARQATELELEAAHAASNRVFASIAARADADGVDAPHAINDSASPMPERAAAATAVVARLRGRDQALTTQLEAERLHLAEQLATADERGHELERELAKSHELLNATKDRIETALAAQRSIAATLSLDASPDSSTSDLLAAAPLLAESVQALADEKEALAQRVQEMEKAELAFHDRLEMVEEKLTEAQSERDEMALSGKEIITQLTQSRDARAHELDILKAEHHAALSRVTTLESRAAAAESANRTLSEALTQLAAAEPDGDHSAVAEGRVDLEMALAQMPDEGETDVVVPTDLGAQLAAGGRKLAAALMERRTQVTTAAATSTQENARLQSELIQAKIAIEQSKISLEQHESDLRDAEAEVQAVRKAMETQGADQAIRVKELSALRGEMATLKAELGEARNHLNDQVQRARKNTESAEADGRERETLTKRVRELETDGRNLNQRLAAAEEKASVVAAEHDELVLSSKEIIAQLTALRDQRTQELDALRREYDQATLRVAELTSISIAASSSSRALADALAELAAADPQAGEGPVAAIRAELEAALDQLPDSDDDHAVVPPDLGERLAASGRKLATTLATHHRESVVTTARVNQEHSTLRSALETAKRDLDQLRSETDQQISALRSSGAELTALRGEFETQGRDLAAKAQELNSNRGETASLQAELTSAQNRIEEQERRLNQATNQLGEARNALTELRTRHDEAKTRAATLGQAQTALVEALRSLTNRQDASQPVARALTTPDANDALNKAAARLDLAHATAPDQLAAAGQGYVRALKDRLQEVVQDLETHRNQLAETRDTETRLTGDLVALKAQIVDRNQEIANSQAALERGKHEHGALMDRILATQRSHDAVAAEFKSTQDQLRQVQAALDDKLARGETSQGLTTADNEELRKDLDAARSRANELDAQVSELSEAVGAAEARLKSQRDELSKRLVERDAIIQQKDKVIDQQVAQRANVKGQDAQIATLRRELQSASDRVRDLESLAGIKTGETVKNDDLGRELITLQEERDRLREQISRTESDLAEERSVRAQIEAQLGEKRKDIEAARSRLVKEMTEVREKSQTLIDENRRFKEEVAGLNARLRRLLEGGKPNPTSGPYSILPATK